MSLFRQLILAISLLIACLLAGNLVVSVYNARQYLAEQMQVHAEDTATSLGFTISQAAKDKDLAQLNSMVDVIFDRGYYRKIVYRNLNGENVVERQLPISIEGVPQWFIEMISLPEPSGKSELVSGWFRLGELEVVAHPGYAYRDLWRVFTEQLWLFMFTAVLCYGLAGIGLHYLLRPLKKVESQAEAICRREFPVQEDLPRTPELRRMVVAMNRMVQKIKDMFQEQVELTETLHRQSHLDPVTELSNRRDFDARFEAFIKSERGGGAGALLLFQIGNMQQFNDRLGRDAGDQCLQAVAAVLRKITNGTEGLILSRRAGADFCAFVPGLTRLEADALAKSMFGDIQNVSWFAEHPDIKIHLGLSYTKTVTLDNQLLSKADRALRQAQLSEVSGWQGDDSQVGDENHQAGEWQSLLQRVLKERSLCLHYQPVFAGDGTTPLHAEVLCRVLDDDKLIPAGVFWPMVERFNMGATVDQLVIELLFEQHANNSACPVLCVNLSPRSVQSQSFVEWLGDFLQASPDFASRLVFELPESTLVRAEEAVRQFAQILLERGSALSLDHFGLGARAFNYLQSMQLQCLKIDRSFVQRINENPDNRFFIKSLAQIAHSCDMKILAEGVETAEEWEVIQSLGLDGAQGYYLGRPDESLQ